MRLEEQEELITMTDAPAIMKQIHAKVPSNSLCDIKNNTLVQRRCYLIFGYLEQVFPWWYNLQVNETGAGTCMGIQILIHRGFAAFSHKLCLQIYVDV